MSVTKPIILDATGQEMVEIMKSMLTEQQATNAQLQIMSADAMATVATDLQAIKHIVQNGYASNIFSVGDQIIDDWTDSVGGTTYSVPHNVVTFQDVELQDGETVPGMWLQWHYSTPYSMPFDAQEAFYYAEDGLDAGIYYFTIGSTWGAFTSGNIYQFTLESAVPAGGQLVFNNTDLYNNDLDGTTLSVYESSTSTDALETAEITKVDSGSGTDLGTFTTAGSGNANSIQRAAYGYNRWSQSAIRQWLNSSADIGEWWEPQNVFDRPPAQLATYPGFLSGYSSAFLSAIQKVKVRTALNTITDSEDGTYEDTYDYIFLPSLEQQYITPQLSGVEGDYWEYWKRATGSSATIPRTDEAGTFPITYAINAKTSAQNVRLRSAYRGSANGVWIVRSTGAVIYYISARSAYRCAPACVIC